MAEPTTTPSTSPPPSGSPAPAVEPGGPASGVALSAVSQLGAKVIHLGLNVVSSLALIRYLSPDQYGEFVLVITVSALSGLLGDFGLARIAVRDIARHPESEPEVVGSVVTARLVLATGGMVVNQVILLLLSATAEVHLAALVISALFWSEAILSVVVVFNVRLQQHLEAGIRIGMEAVETAWILLLVSMQADLVVLMIPPAATAAAGAVTALWIVRRRFGHLPPLSLRYVRPLLVEAAPVAAALILAAVYLKIGSLLLAVSADSTSVGLYGAAYQPIEYLLLGSAVVINVLLPLLSRSFVRGREDFDRVYRSGSELLLAGTLPIAVLLVATAPGIVTAVYGDDFSGAAGPLRLLSLALVALVASFWQATVLLAGGQQRITMIYDLCSVVSVVGLSLALIPSMGPSGAATAVLVTSIGVALVSMRETARRLGPWPAAGGVLRIAGAGAVMVLVLAAQAFVPLGVAVLASLAAYVAVLWCSGIVRRETVAALLDAEMDLVVA